MLCVADGSGRDGTQCDCAQSEILQTRVQTINEKVRKFDEVYSSDMPIRAERHRINEPLGGEL